MKASPFSGPRAPGAYTRAAAGLLLAATLCTPVAVLADRHGPSVPNARVISDGTHVTGATAATSRTYGTTATSYLSLNAHSFRPISSQVTYTYENSPWRIIRTNTSGHPWVEAPLQLPSGAQVLGYTLYYCDSSTTAGLFSWLVTHPRLTGSSFVTGPESSGAPGCTSTSTTFGTPVTIDNLNNTYTVEVNLGLDGVTVGLGSARVDYRLQVSPAPGTASFTDVPTDHFAFQHIEALKASGITAGCTATTFCPSQSVTRAQMAVFLAKALGLHFQ